MLKNVKKIKKSTSWLKTLLIFGLVLCALWFFSLNVLKNYLGEGLYPFYPLWIGLSILIYSIAYISIFETNIYNDRRGIRLNNVKKPIEYIKKNKEDKFEEINKLIIDNQFFLDSELSLSFLSKKANMSEGYISQLINLNSGKNFNEYINELRVEHAKKLLTDKVYFNYTILSIGLESGFNTRSSFFTNFKKITGKTPNQYKKSVQNL